MSQRSRVESAKRTTTRLRQVARAATTIYAQRARTTFDARVRRDPLSQLNLPAGQADPHAVYARMRALGPLNPTPLGNFSTTSHQLCTEVLRSRAFGAVPEDEQGLAVRQNFIDLSLLELNPPDHTRLRRLAGPAFSPRMMASYGPLVQHSVDRLLDRIDTCDEIDLMSTFASPLPITVITDLLGMPGDTDMLRHNGAIIGRALDGVGSLRQARAIAGADRALTRAFEQVVAEKIAHPSADLTSALVQAEGEKLTAAELGPLVRLLLVAGFETTVNAIGNGVQALLQNPEQWRALVAEPDRAPAAVEEILRFDPPVRQTGRMALRDTELAGTPVARNTFVAVLLAAANRDPEVFERPDAFDIGRPRAGDHLAFSGGIHYCLGAPLARMELVAVFRSLATRFPDITLAGPAVRRPGVILRGPSRLPVRPRPRQAAAAR